MLSYLPLPYSHSTHFNNELRSIPNLFSIERIGILCPIVFGAGRLAAGRDKSSAGQYVVPLARRYVCLL